MPVRRITAKHIRHIFVSRRWVLVDTRLHAGWYDALAWFGADEISGDVYPGKR
jgi:hypothetical protein